MDQSAPQHPRFFAEPADQRIVQALDAMTLIYQKRSGITHIVAEPVPQILAVMGPDSCDAALILKRLQAVFDIATSDMAHSIVSERLAELESLGLVERSDA